MKTIVPRELLHAWMARNMARPKDVCTFCGRGGVKLREWTVIFTRDEQSQIDGEYDVRACKRCWRICATHPSYMVHKGSA